jgi:hypothetical protein
MLYEITSLMVCHSTIKSLYHHQRIDRSVFLVFVCDFILLCSSFLKIGNFMPSAQDNYKWED